MTSKKYSDIVYIHKQPFADIFQKRCIQNFGSVHKKGLYRNHRRFPIKIVKFLRTIVGRGVLNPLFYKDSPYIGYPLFQILSTSTPPPHVTCWLQPTPSLLILRTLMHVLYNKASSFIVCIGVSTSPSKTPPPSLFAKPYLKFILVFREPPLKNWIF